MLKTHSKDCVGTLDRQRCSVKLFLNGSDEEDKRGKFWLLLAKISKLREMPPSWFTFDRCISKVTYNLLNKFLRILLLKKQWKVQEWIAFATEAVCVRVC